MSPKYWEYFKIIEADLESTGRYVDFNTENYKTFSNEYAKILITTGSEVDNVMKALCKKIDPSKSPDKINEYYPIVTGRYPLFCEMKLTIPRYGLTVAPWSTWTEDMSPSWWKDGFNKIKHERDLHYSRASLENCILAVGALLNVIAYYYDADTSNQGSIEFRFGPSLFVTDVPHPSGMSDMEMNWELRVLK